MRQMFKILAAITAGAGGTFTTIELTDDDVVPAIAIATEVESLLVVRDATNRYCRTASSQAYMRAACTRFDLSLGRLSRILEHPVQPETVFVHPTTPIDTICQTASCNPGSMGNIGYAVRQYYESDSMYLSRAGRDTVTVCDIYERMDGQKFVGYPPVRLTKGRADSTNWSNRFGNPLTSMCRQALAAEGMSDTTRIDVTWKGFWIDQYQRRLWRPLSQLP